MATSLHKIRPYLMSNNLNHLNKLRIKTNLPKLMFEAHLATNITSSDYLEVNFAMFEASLELCFRLT